MTEPAGGQFAATAWEVAVRAPRQAYASSCACMVRPEGMTAGPPGAVPPGLNGVPATMRDVVFMGEATRYALETEGSETLLVKRQNRAGVPPLRPGKPALITWAVADMRLAF